MQVVQRCAWRETQASWRFSDRVATKRPSSSFHDLHKFSLVTPRIPPFAADGRGSLKFIFHCNFSTSSGKAPPWKNKELHPLSVRVLCKLLAHGQITSLRGLGRKEIDSKQSRLEVPRTHRWGFNKHSLHSQFVTTVQQFFKEMWRPMLVLCSILLPKCYFSPCITNGAGARHCLHPNWSHSECFMTVK